MKIKKILLNSSLILITFLGILLATLLTQNNIPLLMMSAQNEYQLKIENYYYDLPVYLFYCEYDFQEDNAYIKEKTSYSNNDYYIKDNTFNFNQINNDLTYYVEQDSYYMYGDDALASGFFIVASKDIHTTNFDQDLNGTTISELLKIDGVIDIPILNDDEQYTFEIISTKKDEKTPVINGFEGTLTTNVNSPITVEEIKSYLSAEDEIDGDLTDKIKVEEDNYTNNCSVVGKYSIVFSVQDNSKNKATLTIYVQVSDLSDPVIEGDDEIITYISSPITNEEILNLYTAKDDYDGNLTNSIKFSKNTYEDADKTKPCESEIVITVKDSNGNSTSKNIKIILKDDIKPLISGASEYTKNYDTPLTLETIMDNLECSDNVDGDISSLLQIKEDNYSGNEELLGTYTITFKVVDSSENESNDFKISITVVDENLPIFSIDSTIISTHTFEELSLDSIENYLIQNDLINMYNNYNLEITENDYFQNKNVPGTYKMTVKIKYENGSEEKIRLSIYVNDNKKNQVNELSGILESLSSMSIWNKIIMFFKSTWSWILNTIINPIINLFN